MRRSGRRILPFLADAEAMGTADCLFYTLVFAFFPVIACYTGKPHRWRSARRPGVHGACKELEDGRLKLCLLRIAALIGAETRRFAAET